MTQTASPFGCDVCLAVPPFHTLHYPPLGAPILKVACQARGLDTRVVYGGFPLVELAGFEAYEAVCRALKHPKIGDRLFRPFAYEPQVLADMAEPEPLTGKRLAIHDGAAPYVAQALDVFVEQVLALRPRILGISSSFEQNLAAAALARRVRAAAPDTCIVMGGANVAWPMARGLAEVFPWMDYFFAGESDIDFPDFCERLVRHGERPTERIVRSEPIGDMRVVSPPDFTEFLTGLRALQAAGHAPDWAPRYLMLETSRGCWWGAKHHCTFCGLNGDGMDFRDKPPEMVRTELESLTHWGVSHVRMADNIMPRQYLKTLLPDLAQVEPHTKLFYEVKANLTDQDLDIMAAGGIAKIQPGIESLSTNVLRLMRKGISAHQNIALLRGCAAIGMLVQWNIIYGFPGETQEDYERTVALAPLLEHLQPPGSSHEIMIDRYSPFFNEPEELGIGPIRPFPAYAPLYPRGAAIEDIAYHFEADYSTAILGNAELRGRLDAAMEQWTQAWRLTPLPVLQLFDTGKGAVVIDTRRVARARLTPVTAEQVAALIHFERAYGREGLDPALEATADWLVERGFMIDHEDRLISLVVRPRPEGAAAIARTAAEPQPAEPLFA